MQDYGCIVFIWLHKVHILMPSFEPYVFLKSSINEISSNSMVSEEDKVEKLLRDPTLHKQLLLKFLPHITDTLIGAVNNIDAEGSSTREKRSLSTEKVFKPQNLDGMLI